MSGDNQNNPNETNGRRRGSVTHQALAGLFRSNSTSVNSNFQSQDANRRRLSVSTIGIGLVGTSPTNNSSAFNSFRRGSMSTNSDLVDENAIDEDEPARPNPTTPFARRMSFGGQNMLNMRNGSGSPGSNDQGFNWSEQLRSRAESTVQAPRASFSFGSGMSTSPPRGNGQSGFANNRAKSLGAAPEMPAPPSQATAIKPKAPEPQRRKPDQFQERILKGDFYMD